MSKPRTETFKEELKLVKTLKEGGFNPIGVSYMMGEHCFIFNTEEEAKKAYEKYESNNNGKDDFIPAWWYSKESFYEEKEWFEREAKRKVPVLWI